MNRGLFNTRTGK